MKKVVYLAPIFLLSFLGKNAMAGQVEHVSNLDSALEQASTIDNSTADTNKNTTVLQNQVLNINKTNQTAIPDSIKQSTGFQDKKIEANTNVTINNPANNRIHVNWVDANGQNINANGYDIDLTTIQNNSDNEYHWLPKGYQLHNPDGKYTVSGGAFNGTNLKASTDYHSETYRTVYKTETWYGAALRGWRIIPKTSTYKDVQEINHAEYSKGLIHIFPTKQQADSWDGDSNGYEDPGPKRPNNSTYYVSPVTVTNVPKTTVETPAYTSQILPVAFVDSNNNLVGMIQNYSGKVGTTQNVSLTVPTGYKLADGQIMPTSVTFQNSTNPLLVKVVPSGKTQSVTNPANNTINVKFVDQESGQQVGSSTINLTKVHNDTNYYNVPAGYSADVNSYYADNGELSETGIYLEQLGKTVYPDSPNGYDSRLANAIFSNLPGGDFNLEYYRKGDYLTAGYHGRKLDLSADDVHHWHNLMLSVGKGKSDQGIDTKIILDGTVDTGHRSFADDFHAISGNTVTVPVHKTNSFSFADNSGNVKSYSGNIVNVILEHQTKRIDPNNSSLNLDANNQLHLINTNQEQPKQSTTNFKVGYLLDLVTNNKIIDTNNTQALNNAKIFTVNPSLPIGYDSLNTKLLTLNL